MMTSIQKQLQNLQLKLRQENNDNRESRAGPEQTREHGHHATSATSTNRNVSHPVLQAHLSNPNPSPPANSRHFPPPSRAISAPQPLIRRSYRKINNLYLNFNRSESSRVNNNEIAHDGMEGQTAMETRESNSNSSSIIAAQCLSPRPRPRQLPIGSANMGFPGSPSRNVKPLDLSSFTQSRSRADIGMNSVNSLINNNAGDDIKLNEVYKQNNFVLTIDGTRYIAQEEDLKHLDELGTGSCGHVVKMLHIPSQKIVAVKQMRRSGNKDENKRIKMDLDILLACHDCTHIVQCHGYFIKDTEVWIFMELMATCFDKLLKKLKKPIPEPILGKVSVATVKALNYLKDNHGVIHRDIKPSNILINEKGVVKLCDFGISGRLVDSKAKTRSAGCAAYMSPERIIPPDPTNPAYDIRADVWSLGISLVELATGKFPYLECKSDFEVLTKVIHEDPPTLPCDPRFSTEFASFVTACLTKDYKKRPKYKKLLEHDFIKHYDSAYVNVEQWFALVNSQASTPI